MCVCVVRGGCVSCMFLLDRAQCSLSQLECTRGKSCNHREGDSWDQVGKSCNHREGGFSGPGGETLHANQAAGILLLSFKYNTIYITFT